jgi:hypothetical protein
MTTKLNQIIAIEGGLKNTSKRDVTDAYHKIQKTALLNGISRTYKPKDEEGDILPPESTLVQTRVEDVLAEVSTSLTRLFDITLTKEVANGSAKADVVVGGTIIVKDAPVTYLLFLEKQLVDLKTFVAALPTLDPAELWEKSAATGDWATAVSQTVKTKKVPRNWEKSPATDKHPAQVEIFNEDVQVGTWSTTKFSGALQRERRNALLTRVEDLLTAVKFAREDANSAVVTDVKTGKQVFDFLFSA